MPSTSSNQYLPQELVDIVIDHLSGDETSLRSCSLVCNACLDRSRYHIYKSVRVGDGPSSTGFIKFSTFLDTFPSICGYIRELSIQPVDHEIPLSSITIARLQSHTLRSILARLPNLKVLGGQSLDIDPLPWQTVPEFLSASVQTLNVTRIVVDNMVDLAVIFFLFPCLTDLSLVQVSCNGDWPHVPAARTPRHERLRSKLPLKRLLVDDSDAFSELLRIFQTERFVTSLEVLKLIKLRTYKIPTVIAFLRNFGVHLVELEIDLRQCRQYKDEDPFPNPWNNLDVTHCTPLRTFTLYLTGHDQPTYDDPFTLDYLTSISHWHSVLTILSHLPQSIRNIFFVFSADPSTLPEILQPQLKTEAWRQVVQALRELTGLEMIKFSCKALQGSKDPLPLSLDVQESIGKHFDGISCALSFF